MSVSIVSGSGNNAQLTIDATSNAARVTPYDTLGNPLVVTRGSNTPSTPYGVPIAGFNDGAWRVARLDRFGNLRAGFDQMLFHDDVEGTTLNTQLWAQTLTSFTMSQAAATGIFFNAAASTSISQAAQLVSQKQFMKMQQMPLRLRMRARTVWYTGAVAEMGFGVPSGVTAQIPTGAFWRYTSSGSVIPVLAFNGSDVVVGTNISASLNMNGTNYYSWEVIVDDDGAMFVCQDISTGRSISEQYLSIPLTQARAWSVTHLPCFARLYNSTATLTAAALYLSDTLVIGYDTFMNKPWQHQQAAVSNGFELLPSTFAQSANWANSAAPTSATLSNTAAGYTTLGGLYQFAAVAGAATDYALFAFTVPSPYSFYCTGVRISAWNTGAAVATTPTLLVWGLGANNTGASLATAPLRVPIGSQSFAVGSAIGANAPDLDVTFDTPLKTDAGRFLNVILRMPVGTATASQIIQGGVQIRGYFE